ncbi:hypothetical protein OG607_44350 [Streptomyces sp. NBC_01537]|uniref:hypothetical protein n=1 Tax=Streptomyces sp. NBC_01537 TaxID=2903896 RepID=UPI003866E0DD
MGIEGALSPVRRGYEVTSQLREFLESYREITVTWMGRRQEQGVHARHTQDVGLRATRLGRPVLLIGTVFETEECVLLAENGDTFFYGGAGFQCHRRLGQDVLLAG